MVKGGKNLSFSALVVVGDGAGVVGYGMGKAQARWPPPSGKGIEAAKKTLHRIPLTDKGQTIPHTVTGRFGCGGSVLEAGLGRDRRHRRVARCARCSRRLGVQDVLTKSLGSDQRRTTW